MKAWGGSSGGSAASASSPSNSSDSAIDLTQDDCSPADSQWMRELIEFEAAIQQSMRDIETQQSAQPIKEEKNDDAAANLSTAAPAPAPFSSAAAASSAGAVAPVAAIPAQPVPSNSLATAPPPPGSSARPPRKRPGLADRMGTAKDAPQQQPLLGAQTRSHSAATFDGAGSNPEQQLQTQSRLQQSSVDRLTAELQQLRQSSAQQQCSLASTQQQLSDAQKQLATTRQQLSRARDDAVATSLEHACSLCFDAAPSTLTQCCRMVRVCGPCMRRVLAIAPIAVAADPPAQVPAPLACPNCQQTVVDSLPFSVTRVIFDVRH